MMLSTEGLFLDSILHPERTTSTEGLSKEGRFCFFCFVLIKAIPIFALLDHYCPLGEEDGVVGGGEENCTGEETRDSS